MAIEFMSVLTILTSVLLLFTSPGGRVSIDDVLMPMETLPRPPGSPTLKQPEDENTGGSRSDFDSQ